MGRLGLSRRELLANIAIQRKCVRNGLADERYIDEAIAFLATR